MAVGPKEEREPQGRHVGQPSQAAGTLVAHRRDDNGTGVVSVADSRCIAQRRNSHRQADDIQPCARRHDRPPCIVHAERAEI